MPGAGVTEKNERAKNSTGGRARRAVKYGRIESMRAGKMDGVSQGYKPKLNGLKYVRWKDALTRLPPPRERYESNFQARGE